MMYKAISNRILDHLSRNTQIDMEYREIYSYAIEKYFSGIINTILFVAIAMICQIQTEAITFFLFYAPLRRYAGGWHAKTRVRCLLMSVITMLAVIKTAVFLAGLEQWRVITSICLLLAVALVFLFAPVDCENKRFSEKIKLQNKRKSRIIVLSELLILMAVIWFEPLLRGYIVIAAMAILLEGIILIPNRKRRLFNNEQRKKEKQNVNTIM